MSPTHGAMPRSSPRCVRKKNPRAPDLTRGLTPGCAARLGLGKAFRSPLRSGQRGHSGASRQQCAAPLSPGSPPPRRGTARPFGLPRPGHAGSTAWSRAAPAAEGPRGTRCPPLPLLCCAPEPPWPRAALPDGRWSRERRGSAGSRSRRDTTSRRGDARFLLPFTLLSLHCSSSPIGAEPPRPAASPGTPGAATLTLAAEARAATGPSVGEAGGGGRPSRRESGGAVRALLPAPPVPPVRGAAVPGLFASCRLLPVPVLVGVQELPPAAGSARTDVSPAASDSLQPWRRGGGGRGGGEKAGGGKEGGGEEEDGRKAEAAGVGRRHSTEQKTQPLHVTPNYPPRMGERGLSPRTPLSRPLPPPRSPVPSAGLHRTAGARPCHPDLSSSWGGGGGNRGEVPRQGCSSELLRPHPGLRSSGRVAASPPPPPHGAPPAGPPPSPRHGTAPAPLSKC